MTDSVSHDRRSLLKGVGSTMALAAATKIAFPGGAWAQAAGPEVKGAKLGYIALTDAAPLIVAQEKGMFAKHGLPDVEVLKQASWGATRDNMVLGSEGNGIDGAHILSPFPYLLTTGRATQGNVPMPTYVLGRLNLNAQGISVANEYRDLKVGVDASALKETFAKKRASGGDPKVAMTFPGGTHDLWLRYWLASGGIDPDKDVSTIVVPPPQMVANMKVGTMDAFCVGEPWNAQLVNQKLGYTAINTYELWHDHRRRRWACEPRGSTRIPRPRRRCLWPRWRLSSSATSSRTARRCARSWARAHGSTCRWRISCRVSSAVTITASTARS